MTNPKVATSAEQPINSDGAVSTVAVSEGDTVGLNADGEIVAADAGTPQPAVGVMATEVDDPANYPGGQFEYAALTAESQRTLVGDKKAGYLKYGLELVNRDEDWGFTPGEPVYLAVGGGLTQTAPSTAGNIVQVLGVAHAPETVFLDINPDYTTV